MDDLIALEDHYAAHNYRPLDVVVSHAEGSWVTTVDGRQYLDCLAGYSSLNFGHRHPSLVEAARRQLDRVTLTSRAFRHDQLGPLCRQLTTLAATDRMLPMNTGAEAVESAIKVARKWGYEVKGVPQDRATIVVADGSFHGRTTTVVGFSTDAQARDGFGPFTPGFRRVPFGDTAALESALDETTVAVLIEPIQGEAGVIVPPDSYLGDVRELCTRNGVLMIADEIQSGLGRTGRTFACDLWGVTPDIYILGKALGGGILPISAVLADSSVLGVLRPGDHGSTFGGNPLACAVAQEVISMLATGHYQERAVALGRHLHGRLCELLGQGVTAVRGSGLWAGVDIDPEIGSARTVCESLAGRGVLAKDAHGITIRLAPPLVVTRDEVDFAVDALAEVLAQRRMAREGSTP